LRLSTEPDIAADVRLLHRLSFASFDIFCACLMLRCRDIVSPMSFTLSSLSRHMLFISLRHFTPMAVMLASLSFDIFVTTLSSSFCHCLLLICCFDITSRFCQLFEDEAYGLSHF